MTPAGAFALGSLIGLFVGTVGWLIYFFHAWMEYQG